jgi:hypothetical protein
VNGQAFTAGTNIGGSPDMFAIGRKATFTNQFPGLIDHVFVYDRALERAGAG